MSEPLKSLGVITLFAADPQRSKEFYERALGVETVFEDENSAVLKLDNVLVNLLQRGPAVRELLGPVEEAPPGASFVLTVQVGDTDAVCAGLAERGVALVSGPLDRPWGVRTASFVDPDGYVWEVAAEIASS